MVDLGNVDRYSGTGTIALTPRRYGCRNSLCLDVDRIADEVRGYRRCSCQSHATDSRHWHGGMLWIVLPAARELTEDSLPWTASSRWIRLPEVRIALVSLWRL